MQPLARQESKDTSYSHHLTDRDPHRRGRVPGRAERSRASVASVAVGGRGGRRGAAGRGRRTDTPAPPSQHCTTAPGIDFRRFPFLNRIAAPISKASPYSKAKG